MVSACKADVLTGGSVPTGLNYRPTAKESSRLPVDYDLGQDYRALSMLGACPFIERIASFHSGHLWRVRRGQDTSKANTSQKGARKKTLMITASLFATGAFEGYAPPH